MKPLLTMILIVSFTIDAIGQKPLYDSSSKKESFAVAEIGEATDWNIKGGGLNLGPAVAVEITPIENWLELELGVTPAFGNHTKEWDIDLLFKKPWDLSQKVEFMFGVGLVWTHANDYSVITKSLGGEVALDFMFWPFKKHILGWYLEPDYEYSFGRGHEQSVGISGGLLIAIP